MRFESIIAWRHLRSRRKRSLSVVTWLSVIGVVLGVVALVGGFSITSGFEVAFREKVLGVTSHIFVREYGIRFQGYRDVQNTLANVPGVKATGPITYNEGLISGARGTAGIVVKGIIPESALKVLDLEGYMVEGGLSCLSEGGTGVSPMVMGAELARRLGVSRGDVVTLVSPLASPNPDQWSAQAGSPTSRPFRICAIFSAGFQEYDARLVYLELSTSQDFFGSGDTVAGIEVAVDDPMEASVVADRARAELGELYSVLEWQRQNRNLFKSLTYQRLAILVVLSVMVVLASCNVATMLIMVVVERTRDIAILKAMGATNRSILETFIKEGMAVGVLGTAIGLVLAFAFCEGLLANGIALDPKVYGIARLPVVFDPYDYLMAGVGALLITFTATIFPALRGARLAPVDGLRELNG